MAELELCPLSVEDAPGLFAFEVKNRAWFESHVGPRPETYWNLISLAEIVTEQVNAGELMFLLKRRGKILGRVNLTAVECGVAQLGYRIGEQHTGQGVATEAVKLAGKAAAAQGLWAIEARVAVDNPASRRVLEKTGFRSTERSKIGELECEVFRRDLDQDWPGSF